MGRWELRTEGCTVPLARDMDSGEWIGHSVVAEYFVDAHNADCDAYEARIAELEAKAVTATQRIDSLADRCEFQAEQIAELVVERDAARAELARVKAESLRVVEIDQGGCLDLYMTPSGLGNWMFDGNGDESVETRSRIHPINDCKPVRLERWETEE